MDPIIHLESDIRKAQTNKEIAADFFDVEKAYNLLWKEGVLIKLKKMGIEGRIYRWIKDFLRNRKIQVRINNKYSKCLTVDNGVPQGSVISPILFSSMINDIYKSVDSTIGNSLFVDDGALWKRGRNISHVVKSL